MLLLSLLEDVMFHELVASSGGEASTNAFKTAFQPAKTWMSRENIGAPAELYSEEDWSGSAGPGSATTERLTSLLEEVP